LVISFESKPRWRDLDKLRQLPVLRRRIFAPTAAAPVRCRLRGRRWHESCSN
jgi:hypothetical protein